MLDKPGMAFPGVNKVFTNCIKKKRNILDKDEQDNE